MRLLRLCHRRIITVSKEKLPPAIRTDTHSKKIPGNITAASEVRKTIRSIQP